MSTPRPAGAVIIKSAGGGRAHPSGADDSTLFVAFPNGVIRRLTMAEAACWDTATVDYLIPTGREHDPEWLRLVRYDLALQA